MVEGDTNSPTWKFTQYVWLVDRILLSLQELFFPLPRQDRTSQSNGVAHDNLISLQKQPLPDLANMANFTHYRCFGDKGDVEDITEGEQVPSTLYSKSKQLRRSRRKATTIRDHIQQKTNC